MRLTGSMASLCVNSFMVLVGLKKKKIATQ